MKEALLIVDLQLDFLPGGALGVSGGDQIIPRILYLMGQFDLVIATQDWHPEGHVSFASRHGKKVGESILHQGVYQDLWPDHCIQKSRGANLTPEIERGKIERVIQKGVDPEVDSYSAFFDNQRKRETPLHRYLKERGIQSLTIGGLTTEYCVKFTVLDALELGYQVVVVDEACCALLDHEAAMKQMEAAGAKRLFLDAKSSTYT